MPSSLSLGKAPLTISCRSLKSAVINRIQIERKPATGSVYSTLVYVGEGFTPTVKDGKENVDSLVMKQIILRQINSFLMLISLFWKEKFYQIFFIAKIGDTECSGFPSYQYFQTVLVATATYL